VETHPRKVICVVVFLFRCPYMAVKEAEDDEDVTEESAEIENMV